MLWREEANIRLADPIRLDAAARKVARSFDSFTLENRASGKGHLCQVASHLLRVLIPQLCLQRISSGGFAVEENGAECFGKALRRRSGFRGSTRRRIPF